MEKQNGDANKKNVNHYLKFSSIAIQMAALIIAAAYFGKWLDGKQGNITPGWTITLILLAIFASLYQLIKEVMKLGKDDKG
jgi:hypothetical protein